VSAPWRGRETGNVRYLLPASVHVTRAPDCLDSPVGEPDEEHATALVLNAKERMDPAWRMQIVHVVVADSARHQRREKGNGDMRKIAKKRSEVLTLTARLGLPPVIGKAVENPLRDHQTALLRSYQGRLCNAGGAR
jgi:hypothetical protein